MSGEPGQSTPLHDAGRLAVEVVTRCPRWAASGLDHAALALAAEAAYAAAGARGTAADVVLVLADDALIRDLNREWAGKDKATDVLSFPADDAADAPERSLGDIVLAFETVQRDAGEAGLTLTAHGCHLVIHGVLHLLGYDHSTAREAAGMEGLESAILARLGLHDPYALPLDTTHA